MTDNGQHPLENIELHLDNGATMAFRGRQFAGGSWYDEESGILTRQNLYITETNEQVYSIVSGSGQERSHRAYRVSLHGKFCTIFNGKADMTLELAMFMYAVRTLTGLDKQNESMLELLEETLRAANC